MGTTGRTTGRTSGRTSGRTHRWMDDACLRCGLRRREEWLLDRPGRPVLALVWTDRSGDVRVQPFPPMKGVEAPVAPTLRLDQAFPGLETGPEPPCPPPSARPAL